MLLLAIDTAGPACAVALAHAAGQRDNRPEILARVEERIGRGHAERLMPMIEEALARAESSFDDLDRIAVTVGPGSFTGVRVGVAAARGLALALDIPTVGIGSLAAIALPVAHVHGTGTVLAALDAKRGEVYALAQSLSSGAVSIEATSIPIGDLAARINRLARPLILVGAGAPIVANAIGPDNASIFSETDAPDIADVAALGFLADAASLPAPLYARGADAKPQADKALARR
jgi:tRNA threonylcarbamoyladenosine biosynthesis protein TsaB